MLHTLTKLSYSEYPSQGPMLPTPIDADQLRDAVKNDPAIDWVIIPGTWWGMGGSPIVDRANIAYLDKHYGKRVHTPKGESQYAFTRTQILRYEELRDIIVQLTEYPVLSDETYSEIEGMELLEHVTECLHDVLWETHDKEFLRNWAADNVELWADGYTCFLDNDGITPYMSEESTATLVAAFRADPKSVVVPF